MARRVVLHDNRDTGPRQHQVEQIADRDRAARADVVRAARRPSLGNRTVRAHGIPHVRQIPPRLEIAHRELGRPPAGFHIRDSPREAGRHEPRILPRPEVVERARHEHGRTVLISRTDHLLRELADGIRARRRKPVIFTKRLIGRRIHHRGAWNDDARIETRIAQSFDQIVCTANVDGKRRLDMLPRASDVSGAGEVVDRGWCGFLERPAHRILIQQIDRPPSHSRDVDGRRAAGPMPRDGVDAVPGEQIEQMAARKARCSRDESSPARVRRAQRSPVAPGKPAPPLKGDTLPRPARVTEMKNV